MGLLSTPWPSGGRRAYAKRPARTVAGIACPRTVARSMLGASVAHTQSAILTASLLVVAGCATTKLDAQWSDPQFAGRSLRGAKVLIACEAAEVAVRRICQEQLAAQVSAVGARPVMGPDFANPTPGRLLPADQYLPAARGAGAAAVLAAAMAPDASYVAPGPSIGFGIGGFGGSHGGGGVGVGVGLDLPVGAGKVRTAYAANSMLTDVASGRMMWSVKASTPASEDLGAQVAELAKAVVGAAQKAGLF